MNASPPDPGARPLLDWLKRPPFFAYTLFYTLPMLLVAVGLVLAYATPGLGYNPDCIDEADHGLTMLHLLLTVMALPLLLNGVCLWLLRAAARRDDAGRLRSHLTLLRVSVFFSLLPAGLLCTMTFDGFGLMRPLLFLLLLAHTLLLDRLLSAFHAATRSGNYPDAHIALFAVCAALTVLTPVASTLWLSQHSLPLTVVTAVLLAALFLGQALLLLDYNKARR